ncbi:MAG: aspartate kinase [Clostridia bacterium]|nr:aspartate kinase [Clostridia bacterium]
MGIKVAKFGGSSVADTIQFSKVKDIILADPSRRYVVVSAPGKRFDQDTKMTDLLLLCHTHLMNHLPWDQLFQVVCDRFSAIAFTLDIGADKLDLQAEYNKIKHAMEDGAGSDYIASRGEYLSARLIAAYLGWDFIDAADVIKFDERGRFLAEETNSILKEELKKHEYAVIPGFYGAKPDGKIKTFSRGGSDISGSIVARAAEAEVYENWTDVNGFLMANPKIVKNPKPIRYISYQELRELSYMGANVMHEDAIFPVKEAGIPINIRNTNEPDHPGTFIQDKTPQECMGVITGVAGSKNFTVIAMHKYMMNSERGFMKRVFSILDSNDVSFEHMPTGIDTLSVVLDNDEVGNKLPDIIEDIKRTLEPDMLEVYDDIAMIATVGQGMTYRPGVAAKLFAALAEQGINIRMIDQGSSEINIIVGVAGSDFEKAICAIYNAFN